jgi:plastocyanin
MDVGIPEAQTEPMRKALQVLAVSTVLAVVAAGCGGDGDKESKGSLPVTLEGTTNNHGTKDAKDKLEVEADDFYFGPTFIKATSGQQFSVELKNEGGTAHTFTITALGVDVQVAPGESKTFTVTAPTNGSVQFHCRFHQSQGMQGAVFVA